MSNESEEPTIEPKSPQSQSESARFFKRLYSLIKNPTETWSLIVEEREERGKEFTRYYFPSILLWISGSIFGSLYFGVYYPVSDAVTNELSFVHIFPDKTSLIGQQCLFAFFYVLLPFMLAKPLYLLTKLFAREEERDGEKVGTIADARRLLIYFYAPILAASALQSIPVLSIVSIIVFLRGLVVFYKGASPVMGIAQSSRFRFFLLSMFLLLLYNVLAFMICQDVIGNPYEDAIQALPSK